MYIDSARSLKHGRRVPKEFACARPTAMQIAEVAKNLKFPIVVEPRKRHPRDPFSWGRCRVQLRRGAEGSFINDEIKTRKQLMRKIGEMVPRLKSRVKQEESRAAAMLAAEAKAQNQATAAAIGGSSKKKGRKKKGKKGRR
jgi:signal recognition particle subunit SRP19